MSSPDGRIAQRFKALEEKNQKALVTFVTAGDPDLRTSAKILETLANSGADIIEIGMPFSDPMADGPIIQAANLRAFKAGVSLIKVLDLVRDFRATDHATPLVLMGYYNPIFVYGVDRFLKDAKAAGVDGFIVVDLPPEEDTEFSLPSAAYGLNFINLITPTTDAKRLPAVLKNASGFLYYVSFTGTTGSQSIDQAPVERALKTLKVATKLPIVVGFGITTPEQAAIIAKTADGVVVGSAIINTIVSSLDPEGNAKPDLLPNLGEFVRGLADAVHRPLTD